MKICLFSANFLFSPHTYLCHWNGNSLCVVLNPILFEIRLIPEVNIRVKSFVAVRLLMSPKKRVPLWLRRDNISDKFNRPEFACWHGQRKHIQYAAKKRSAKLMQAPATPSRGTNSQFLTAQWFLVAAASGIISGIPPANISLHRSVLELFRLVVVSWRRSCCV